MLTRQWQERAKQQANGARKTGPLASQLDRHTCVQTVALHPSHLPTAKRDWSYVRSAPGPIHWCMYAICALFNFLTTQDTCDSSCATAQLYSLVDGTKVNFERAHELSSD